MRGRLMELQQRARDMEEATTRLEAQCGALREQIGAKNADIERWGARSARSLRHTMALGHTPHVAQIPYCNLRPTRGFIGYVSSSRPWACSLPCPW